MDEPDSNNGGGGPGAGATTYVVVAGEDGAVRFYDLKFRLEVSTPIEGSAGGGAPDVLRYVRSVSRGYSGKFRLVASSPPLRGIFGRTFRIFEHQRAV